MRALATIGLEFFILNCTAQNQKTTIKTVVLEQLKYTHTEQNWFAPINVALTGVIAEQSNWRDSTENPADFPLVRSTFGKLVVYTRNYPYKNTLAVNVNRQ